MRYRNATFLFNLNKRRIFRKPTLNGLYTPFGSPVSGQKPSLPLKKGVLKSSRPSFLIKRAALGNLKASFHCTHWHRFFPLKKAPPFSPSLSSLRKRGCNRPTVLNFLPLRLSCKESSTFSPSPSQWSLHPLRFPRSRGTETSGSGDVTALRCSEPLRSKVGGASKPFAILCGMGPPYYNLLLVFAILCGLGPPGVGSL